MAGDHALPASHDTALCLVLPQDQWDPVDQLRASNDRAYGKWPPHINLIYPFVNPENLDKAKAILLKEFKEWQGTPLSDDVRLSLGSADYFEHKKSTTLFLHDDDPATVASLDARRRRMLSALSRNDDAPYRMHMTVAQAEEPPTSDKHHFLLEKLRLLPTVAWQTSEVMLLSRDSSGVMRPWEILSWTDASSSPASLSYPPSSLATAQEPVRQACCFSQTRKAWVPGSDAHLQDTPVNIQPGHLIVASYNVLAEFSWPPTQQRYSLIIQNLLEKTALADILILQEVTDDFLPALLGDPDIRARYTYVSHAPPQQSDAGPLPHMLNVVVLSRHDFSWRSLLFPHRHKSACLATFDGLARTGSGADVRRPLVLAACHLSQGLTDGALVNKQAEVQHILSHLKSHYRENPWIVAGDFNITTSSYTINAALRSKSISTKAVALMEDIETSLFEAGLADTWKTVRLEMGESSDDVKRVRNVSDVFEGEQGATFDPQDNLQAQETLGSGFNNRPQRYDRILLKGDAWQPAGFNMFGFTTGVTEAQDGGPTNTLCASDHWGIRCLLKGDTSPTRDRTRAASVVPLSLQHAPSACDTKTLYQCLSQRNIIPDSEDEVARRKAIDTLETVLLGGENSNVSAVSRGKVLTVLVPVGSYGLGVWTRTSDVDLLCIGSASSDTFFRLAKQRLRKAHPEQQLRLLRTVNANTGTMMELDIQGVKADLQYCQATSIAERWPSIMKRPSDDPAFSLKFETLTKLKPARDLFYLKRSIPDLAQFRLAYYFIKTWAKARGIYSAKFGYLGGIQLSVLLVRVCKMLADNSSASALEAPDVIFTFFAHYAGFNWESDIVFDPFFHKTLKYHRTTREPMCLLGWHAPSLNTATAASKPTVKTIACELKRASGKLAEPRMDWMRFLGAEEPPSNEGGLSLGAADFVKAHKSYVKLNIHYWGTSLAKGSKLVGWLESRCVGLLVDLSIKVPGLLCRIWPQRFIEGAPTPENTETSESYQGLYLIGLDPDESRSATKQDPQSTIESLNAVLRQFERRIHLDETYYDSHTSWFSTSVVRASELGSLSLDTREWGTYVDDGDSDSEDDDDEFDDDAEDVALEAKQANASFPSRAIPLRPKPEGAGKFRTALDVLNRIRWDPAMDSHDFIVGHLDRFDGVQEKAVDAWKSEQTDEEFIPQHRILFFKRKSDGVILWERSSRTDKIFGSGYGDD